MPMLKRIKRRLGSRAGESLTEVLVALMVSAIGLMLLAGMINVSSNMVTRSKDSVRLYVGEEAKMIEKNASAKVEGSYSVSFNKVVNNVDGRNKSPMKLINSWSESSIAVDLYSNSKSPGNTTVVLY